MRGCRWVTFLSGLAWIVKLLRRQKQLVNTPKHKDLSKSMVVDYDFGLHLHFQGLKTEFAFDKAASVLGSCINRISSLSLEGQYLIPSLLHPGLAGQAKV